MKRKTLLVALMLLALLFASWRDLLAAPLPPLLVVNHKTKQCSQIFGGDECMDCFPPEGWEILGFDSQAECPSGYTFIEDVEYTCQGFKNQFCCSEGHSGAAGDCEDLVVNEKARQCAFVEEIQGCQLPEGWTQRPESTDRYHWTCPDDYEWGEDLSCVAGTSSGEEPTSGGLSCLGAALVGPAVLILWLLTKRIR
jgi:hypothetical protein